MSTDVTSTVVIGFRVPLGFLYEDRAQSNCEHKHTAAFCPTCGTKAGTQTYQARKEGTEQYMLHDEGHVVEGDIILTEHTTFGPAHTLLVGHVLVKTSGDGYQDEYEWSKMPVQMPCDVLARLLDSKGIPYIHGSYGVHTATDYS